MVYIISVAPSRRTSCAGLLNKMSKQVNRPKVTSNAWNVTTSLPAVSCGSLNRLILRYLKMLIYI